MIPELRVMLTAPTVESEIRLQMVKTFRKLDNDSRAIDQARAPLVEQQLKQLRPKFDAASKEMSAAERDIAWQQIV